MSRTKNLRVVTWGVQQKTWLLESWEVFMEEFVIKYPMQLLRASGHTNTGRQRTYCIFYLLNVMWMIYSDWQYSLEINGHNFLTCVLSAYVLLFISRSDLLKCSCVWLLVNEWLYQSLKYLYTLPKFVTHLYSEYRLINVICCEILGICTYVNEHAKNLWREISLLKISILLLTLNVIYP